MLSRKLLCLLPVVFSAAISTAAAYELEVSFDAGLTGISFGEHALLADSAVKVTRVVVTDEYRERHNETLEQIYGGERRTFTNADITVLDSEFNPATRTLTQTFHWGKVAATYKHNSSNLDINIKVDNTSDKVIELVELTLMELQLPEKPEIGRVSHIQRFHSDTNIGGFDVRRARYDGGQIIYVSTTPNQPVRQNFVQRDENKLVLTLAAGHEKGGREVYHGIWNSMPIKPGESDTYKLSLRFAPRNADPYAMVTDIWRAFGEEFPQTFTWNDRRPIGEHHVGDGRRDGRNPRGWFQLTHDRNFPAATDEAYMERFRESMLANAQRTVNLARQQGLQGLIVWQLEGMQEPGHAYYGDPRILPYVAPEMDAVADEFFRILRDAGLRVGLTIRPVIQIPFDPKEGEHRGPVKGVVTWEKMREAAIRADWSIQFRGIHWQRAIPEELLDVFDPEEAWCPVTRLDNKIKYAKERWGATIFYLDANSFHRPRDTSAEGWGWRGLLISAEDMKELQRRHPDCLIIPEHQYPQHHAHGAQYSQPPGWGRVTGADVRAAYPETATIIKVTDRSVILDHIDTYIKAVEEGDMLFGSSFYGGDVSMVQAVYGKAMESAPFQIELSTYAILLNEEPIENIDQLKKWLAPALEHRPPFRARRAFVRYAKDVSPARLQAVLDAIIEAGGIIGWTQVDDQIQVVD